MVWTVDIVDILLENAVEESIRISIVDESLFEFFYAIVENDPVG